MKNVRIWHNHRGSNGESSWVRITVGEAPVEFVEGGPNEEGYSYSCSKYFIEGDRLQLEATTESRDCDGRLDSYRDLSARIVDGRVVTEPHWNPEYAPPDGLAILWEDERSCQRDYAAEAAGY